MIILDATTKSLEVVLGGAITTNQLPFTTHYVDINSSDLSVSAPAENDGQTNNTTAVAIVAAPASGKIRVVKTISIYNADTVSATVTIRVNNNGTTRIVFKATLATGDTLNYEDD